MRYSDLSATEKFLHIM